MILEEVQLSWCKCTAIYVELFYKIMCITYLSKTCEFAGDTQKNIHV